MTCRILAVSGDTVTLSQGETIGCFGCMRQECKTHRRHFTAENPLGLALSVGQIVEVETSKAALLSQALQALLPPSAGFLGGFLIVGILFPRTGEPVRAAGGVLALGAAACITYWIRKRFPLTAVPQVTRVCDSALSACKIPMD